MTTKRILLIILICLIVLSSVSCLGCIGCVACVRSQFPQPSTTKEAKEWFETEYGYSIKISRDYTLVEDDFGFYDRVWTARLKEYPDIEFELMCDTSNGLLTPSYYMTTNFNRVYGDVYFNEYANTHTTSLFVIDDAPYFRFSVAGCYSDREEIRSISEELAKFGKYLEEQPVKFETQYHLYYRLGVPDSEISNAAEITLLDEYNAGVLAEYALNAYTSYCVQYQVHLDEFTYEEQVAAVAANDGSDRFYLVRPDGTMVTYEDLMCREYGYGLTFGTVYEVLRRENYPTLAGDASHFSFVGADGNTYEYSYDFVDPTKEDKYGEKHDTYYYLKNGEVTYTEWYWYNFLERKEFNEITGYSYLKEYELDETSFSDTAAK